MEQRSQKASTNFVTDLKYRLDPAIHRKLDFLCRRCSEHKHQNVLITDGKEGYGKSTCTAHQAYYMAYKMKRKLKLFFSVDALTEEAKNNKDEIYIWDDAAISGLTLEAYNKEIIKFIKVLLLARKKRHTYFINIQEVFRLKEPIVARASGMTRVYSPDEISLGRFVFYLERPLQKLYFDWTHGKKKMYNKYYNLRGYFPNVLYDIFDEKDYEKLKDESILSIGLLKESGKAEKSIKLQNLEHENELMKYKISQLTEKLDKTQKEVADLFDVAPSSISSWKRYSKEVPRVTFQHQTEPKKTTKLFIEPKTDYLSIDSTQTYQGPYISG